jgi:AcrR family transcriptional regulator
VSPVIEQGIEPRVRRSHPPGQGSGRAERSSGGPSVETIETRGPNIERHARSRAALLDAALVVFARDGFAAARTGDIVSGTGLTRGALYYHFPDKLALFDAVVEKVGAEIAARIDAIAQPASSAREGLRRGCGEWLDLMTDQQLRRVYLVDGPAALGPSRWREIDNAHGVASLREGIGAVVSELGEDPLQVEPLTVLLSGALNEAALWLADAPDPFQARRSLNLGLDTLLDRLFPEAGERRS